MKLKRWLVFLHNPIAGTHWHAFWTRREQREFARKHDGERYEVVKSGH